MAPPRQHPTTTHGEDMRSRTAVPPPLGEQKRYWDDRWENVKGEYPHAWARRRGAAVLAMLRPLPLQQPRSLDLGCGTGWFTEELAQLGEATGIELSESAVALARARYPHATFIAGSALDSPLPPAHFDLVVSLEVIAHVEDQGKYLDQAAHTLKPGGYLIVTTVNKFVHDRTDWPGDSPGHIRYSLDRRSLRRLLIQHGFHPLRTTSVLPMGNRGILRLVNSHKLSAVLRWLIPEPTLAMLKERAGLGWTLIMLAQKPR